MNRVIYLAVLLFSQLELKAQQESHLLQAEKYIDFLTSGTTVVGLTSSGQIKAVEIGKQMQARTFADTGVKSISLGRDGNLITQNKFNQISTVSLDGKRSRVIFNPGFAAYQVVEDSKGHMFIVSRHGIQKLGSPVFYFPDTSYNRIVQQVKPGWYVKPSVYMASDDRIWIGLNNGEWGGDIVIYDTRTSKFILPALDSLKTQLKNVSAIVGNDSLATVITGGGNSVYYGSLTESDGKRSRVMYSYRYQFGDELPTVPEIRKIDMRFSSGVINPLDKKLYLSNANGIFTAENNIETGKVELRQISESKYLADEKQKSFSDDLKIRKLGAVSSGQLVILDAKGRLFICAHGLVSPLQI